jgi:uncharacterized membrane protein
MYFLILFAVKLLDPLTIVLAVIAGALSRTWWQAGAAALLVAAIVDIVLSHLQPGRQFEPIEFAVGFLAAFTWAALIFSLKRWRAKRTAMQKPPSSPR